MKNILYILFLIILFSIPATAKDIIDIDFTRDSTLWIEKFPGMTWNTNKTDFTLGSLDNFSAGGLTFKGSFGKFNPGTGVYAQPIDSEDPCKIYIWAFRLANTGNSYIVFPEVQNAGVLTIHCKSGNSAENAVFYIEKLVDGKWIHVRTMIAPPHKNLDYDVVLRQNLNIGIPVSLRIYGASKNLHVYSINLKSQDSQPVKKSLRLIVLPDTQTYVKDYPSILQAQTAWIANNADSISFVIHVGDITNANSTSQWPIATNALFMMDGNVPYTFAPGNHDIGTNGSSDTRNTTMLNQYLPYIKYSLMPDFGGIFEEGKMDNSWHKFSTNDGYNFLIISLEFAPRNSVLQWAGDVIKEHPNYNVIINTHAYLYSDDKRISEIYGHKWTPSTYGLYTESEGDANNGEQMWDKLVKLYPNIFMVVCGHVLNDGVGTLISEGVSGNKVYQMLANYQYGVTNTVNGGDGFLRVLDINTNSNTLNVQSYSPYLNEYKEEEDQHFSFENIKLIKNDINSLNKPLHISGFNISIKENSVCIQNELNDPITINIFDTLGKLIFTQRNSKNCLDLTFTKGCYIVQVDNGKDIITKKIIIQSLST